MVEQASSIDEIRHYIATCKRRAEQQLGEGFGSVEAAVDAQLMIEHAATFACRHGRDGELVKLRALSDRTTVVTHALMLREMLFRIEHGERPPEEPWRWTDFEKVIASSRACGLDVIDAENALVRAREVAASRARGCDSPEHDVWQEGSARAPRASRVTSRPQVDVPSSSLAPALARVPERPLLGPASAPAEPDHAQPTVASGDVRAAEPEASPGESDVHEPSGAGSHASPESDESSPRDAGAPEPASEAEPPPDAPEPARPRFMLVADASEGDFRRHFLDVEAAIPPLRTGAAIAVILWKAIREAHDRGDLPISGTWVELVAALHYRGHLSLLPSDRASRAALLILAELSPLVRRLHHRRWVLGVER